MIDRRFGTPFLETEALMALLEGQDDAAWESVKELNGREARAFGRACDTLARLVRLRLRGLADIEGQSDG